MSTPSLTKWLQVRLVPPTIGSSGKTHPQPPNQLLKGPDLLTWMAQVQTRWGCSIPCPQLSFQVVQASQLSSRSPMKANPSREESLLELLGWRADVGKYCSLTPESPTPYLTVLGGSRKDSTPWGHESRCPSIWIMGKRHGSAHHSMGLVFPLSHTRVQGSALYPMGDISTNPASCPGGPGK